MTSSEVRQKYLDFFKSSPRDHKEIEPAPLVLENDPSTLFTSAGMQPLVPYLLGKKHPQGKRLTDSQPALRMGDIEEVGDNRHNTFFEMLGNWSLGDYFKKEQLPWIWEFLTQVLNLDPKRLYVTVYAGDKKFGVPQDSESVDIWKDIFTKEKIDSEEVWDSKNKGMQNGRIFYYEDNWWSMTGTPNKMEVGHIGGPDSEVFYEFPQVKHDPTYGKQCHPNCDCGRFLEVGNSVFIQYKKVSENKLEELPQKNVDFGGGLERLAAAAIDSPDVFRTDLFLPAIKEISKKLETEEYGSNDLVDRDLRIIVEHLRASSALISNEVLPGNKGQGYVLRKLLRRAVLHARFINKRGVLELPRIDFSNSGIPLTFKSVDEINDVIQKETDKFAKALDSSMTKMKNAIKNNGKVTSELIFDLYQSHGLPVEAALEVANKENISVSDDVIEEVNKRIDTHKEQSRSTSAGVFKGGLADHSEEVVKLHTATHLLLASLRKVLGEHVVQKGQNITKDRSRFDFPSQHKLTDEQLKSVEDMINDVIEKDLPVKYEVMPKEEALQTGAVHAFNEKYADTVKVYFVGKNLNDAFSKEFCGGPHVSSTGKIGRVRIKKQEKIGAGVVRIYLISG